MNVRVVAYVNELARPRLVPDPVDSFASEHCSTMPERFQGREMWKSEGIGLQSVSFLSVPDAGRGAK